MKVDVVVLGAGMVGISTAIHLMDRGRSVALVDRRGPAEETSYGNAGLIQSEAVMPYVFPRDPMILIQAAFARRTDARVRWSALPKIAPFIIAYARSGSSEMARRTAAANVPILARVRQEHEALMDRADARHLLREGGYIIVFRNGRDLEAHSVGDEATRREYGVEFEVWDGARTAAEEPNLLIDVAGAIHYPTPARVDDPGDVGKAYAALFEASGGRLMTGDARSLTRTGTGWQVTTEESGPLTANEVVVALGAWSGEVLRPLGVNAPLGVKRGYHMHYRLKGNVQLNRLMFDGDNGYVLTPNKRGIRLTSGAEFADRDAKSNFGQIDKAEEFARGLFPLGERIEAEPWRGARPCLPDMLPAIGPVTGQSGLFVNFGHHHLGFTMGPATGRLLAEVMTGETPYTDPSPYSLDRF
ncbi:amino acid dehydrogenase [Acuticoccus sediminis]|uniref:Amino acid dehydrogenase n=1 Tax=Acuticoccus sediminis TaxID=2184697 RepID=A0A8B2NMH9_9HYPH|nr:FAD-binding oxidoreductase [Acuticoccus sediminis]RAH99830.1 amino acid dehydrogenase [Acuticoccus sediminis]